MTFVQRIESLSVRFLSERAHELIVVPALADIEYDETGALRHPIRDRRSILTAFAGAAYEDLASRSTLPTIAALVLIPATYYAFFIVVLVAPKAVPLVKDASALIALASAVCVLSIAPVVACCWPERAPQRRRQPDAADA